jgi:hypothetical protein
MPFEKEFGSKGYFYNMSSWSGISFGEVQNSDLSKLLESVKEVTATYQPMLDTGGHDCNMVSYDDRFIQAYQPELQNGTWFDLSKEYDNEVPIVVSENEYGFKVGDVIQLGIFDGTNNPETLNCKIVGILRDGTKVIGLSPPKSGEFDFRNMYQNYNYEIEEMPLLIFAQSTLQGKNVGSILNGNVLVTYDEDISDEAIERNKAVMTELNTVISTPFDEMKRNSIDVITEQLYILLPIAISVFVLTTVSGVSISALSAKKQLRNYAVFYICGLKWRQCAAINFVSSFVVVGISFAATIAGILLFKNTELLSSSVIEIAPVQMLFCLAIFVLYLLIAMILPVRIINRSSPREVLKEA